MDCEWKPYFYDDSGSAESSESSDDLDPVQQPQQLKQPVATFQLATRDFAFIIDTKYLIEKLDTKLVERFGELVLFSENLHKLGYSFQQDAKKLYAAFPTLKHKFAQFTDEIINIDEIASIVSEDKLK